MDRNKICEAMYALPGGVVVKRRKSQLRAAVLFIAGVALVVVNNMYGAELTNNMRSAIVFIGGLILSGMVMAAIQLFGSGGVPFHKDKHCYLVFEELYFDRGVRADVVQSVENGAVDRLLGLARANVPALTVALYRTPDNSFAAMQAFEYADLEYKPLTRLNIVDKA